jgi:hypothetical protein
MLNFSLPLELRYLAILELVQPGSVEEFPHYALIESVRMYGGSLRERLVPVRERHLVDDEEYPSRLEEVRERSGGFFKGLDVMVRHACLSSKGTVSA